MGKCAGKTVDPGGQSGFALPHGSDDDSAVMFCTIEGLDKPAGIHARCDGRFQAGHDGHVDHPRALIQRVVDGGCQGLHRSGRGEFCAVSPGIPRGAVVRGGLPDRHDLRIRGYADVGASDDAGDDGAVDVAVKKRLGVFRGDKIRAGHELIELRVRGYACIDDGYFDASARC